jgi:peptidoglycan/LPS O-acetylase OafA/YrhL
MALLVSLGWRAGVAQQHAGESLQRYAYLLKAFPGMLFLFVAGLSINHWAGSAHLAVRRALLLPAVAIYVALLWLLDANKAVLDKGGPLLVTWDLLAGLSIALVIAALIHPGKSVRWLGSTVLVRLGDWSYGIYLWHFPVLRWLPKLLPLPWNTVQGSAGALGLCLVITLLLAFASHEWVEKPALAWLARRQRAPRRTLSQTSQNPSLPPPQTP